ncbi:hypothetical protein CCP4SC76_6200002 [Gammaproteobacteria bacterium]
MRQALITKKGWKHGDLPQAGNVREIILGGDETFFAEMMLFVVIADLKAAFFSRHETGFS